MTTIIINHYGNNYYMGGVPMSETLKTKQPKLMTEHFHSVKTIQRNLITSYTHEFLNDKIKDVCGTQICENGPNSNAINLSGLIKKLLKDIKPEIAQNVTKLQVEKDHRDNWISINKGEYFVRYKDNKGMLIAIILILQYKGESISSLYLSQKGDRIFKGNKKIFIPKYVTEMLM